MRRPAALAVAAALLVPAHAGATTYTTFEARSEGCSGGGEVCGTFPLVRAGSASYEHRAQTDGTVDLSVRVEGGIPSPGCVGPYTCVPPLSQYHAEAAGTVWVDVETADGASAVAVRADYRLVELTAARSALVGRADVSLSGAVTVAEAPASTQASCSDGSDVAGRVTEAISAGSEPGEHTIVTTLGCAGGGTLSAARWRVALSLRVAGTTDGGTAEARAHAALVAVAIDV